MEHLLRKISEEDNEWISVLAYHDEDDALYIALALTLSRHFDGSVHRTTDTLSHIDIRKLAEGFRKETLTIEQCRHSTDRRGPWMNGLVIEIDALSFHGLSTFRRRFNSDHMSPRLNEIYTYVEEPFDQNNYTTTTASIIDESGIERFRCEVEIFVVTGYVHIKELDFTLRPLLAFSPLKDEIGTSDRVFTQLKCGKILFISTKPGERGTLDVWRVAERLKS